MKSQLPDDKYTTALNNLKFPIPTNRLTRRVFVKLAKIFDGRNPAFNYQFKTSEYGADWSAYRQHILEESKFWSNTAWDYFKTEINCVMVVDMPLVPDIADNKPQPYIYFVPIQEVVSYEIDARTGGMLWIIYKYENKFIVLDGESYRTYSKTEKNGLGERLSSNPHSLGYCPARFFWNESLSLGCPDIKQSPLSRELSALDWYLFKSLGVKHLDTYASYPIYSAYEEECDYSDKDGNVCHKGHLQSPDGTFLTDLMGNPVLCPVCHGKKQLAGAGSFISVPIPEEGQPDLRNPVTITTIDKQSLDYNVGELKRLETEIINSCVGVDNTILNETSLADKQVDATFESQDNVLNRIKAGFEDAQEWADKTICRLRYGDAFIDASINYGNEFYTLTPEALQKRYNAAQEGGASESELDALRQQLIETTYRHNPMAMRRMFILKDLEPFVHRTLEQVREMQKEGIIPIEMFLLKADFMGFIRRFERENNNILDFGNTMPYEKKIETIYNSLIVYAKERAKRPSLT